MPGISIILERAAIYRLLLRPRMAVLQELKIALRPSFDPFVLHNVPRQVLLDLLRFRERPGVVLVDFRCTAVRVLTGLAYTIIDSGLVLPRVVLCLVHFL